MPGPDGKPAKPSPTTSAPPRSPPWPPRSTSFPAGSKKVNFALELAQLSTQGDPHRENIQAVTDTLSTALTETPTSGKKGKPAPAYMELARLVHYAHMTTTVTDPQLAEAEAILTANDASVAKADFTLTDLNNKKVTLSALRGKIVLVNFFSLACLPCQNEMADLNLIYHTTSRRASSSSPLRTTTSAPSAPSPNATRSPTPSSSIASTRPPTRSTWKTSPATSSSTATAN